MAISSYDRNLVDVFVKQNNAGRAPQDFDRGWFDWWLSTYPDQAYSELLPYANHYNDQQALAKQQAEQANYYNGLISGLQNQVNTLQSNQSQQFNKSIADVQNQSMSAYQTQLENQSKYGEGLSQLLSQGLQNTPVSQTPLPGINAKINVPDSTKAITGYYDTLNMLEQMNAEQLGATTAADQQDRKNLMSQRELYMKGELNAQRFNSMLPTMYTKNAEQLKGSGGLNNAKDIQGFNDTVQRREQGLLSDAAGLQNRYLDILNQYQSRRSQLLASNLANRQSYFAGSAERKANAIASRAERGASTATNKQRMRTTQSSGLLSSLVR